MTAIAQAQGCKVARVNNSDTTTIQDYFGSWLPVGKGVCAFQKGVLYSCLESGDWLLADELNLAPPAVIMMLAPILEGHATVKVPGSDNMITVHPRFRSVYHCNLMTKAGHDMCRQRCVFRCAQSSQQAGAVCSQHSTTGWSIMFSTLACLCVDCYNTWGILAFEYSDTHA